MTESRQSDSRQIFGIEPLPGGRYEVSSYFDGMWRGAVRADTLQEAASAAVIWHVTGEWPAPDVEHGVEGE